MNNKHTILIISLLCILPCSCKKEKPTVPVIKTTAVTEISQTTATSGGNVTDNGGSQVISRGICWSLSVKPTTAGNRTTEEGDTGAFSSSLIDLIPNTLYYIRAYATNRIGTGYGEQVSFTTSQVAVPSLTTTDITLLTNYTARSGGNITADYSGAVTSRGVCWGRMHNPTISDYITADGDGTGAYSSYINWIAPSSTYYLRAYATNSAGTGYGNEISITSLDYPVIYNPDITYDTVSDIDNNIYKTVTIGTQVWMAENLRTSKFNDGSSIPYITDKATWAGLTTPGYSWLNNDDGFMSAIGGLYNFYAVATGNLCPTGWHVPDEAEFTTLEYYLGGVAVAGGKLKETGTDHWKSPNTAATNESGFTALPAPDRDAGTGYFVPIDGTYCCWWLSDAYSVSDALFFSIVNENGRLQNDGSQSKRFGFSVRCIKN